MSYKRVRAKFGIVAFIAAGLSAVISAVAYGTTLLGVSFPIPPPNVVNTGGSSGFVKSYIYYPHYFGPPFLLVAVILVIFGVVLTFRFRGEPNNLEG